MKKTFFVLFLAFLTVLGPAQTVRKRNAIAVSYSPASTSDIAGFALAGLRFGF